MERPIFDRLIFILIDGAPYEVLLQLLEEGELPHIRRWVTQQGSFSKGISVFPSTTGPAYLPFVQGLFPGTANIPGIRWMSRQAYAEGRRYAHPGICSYMGLEAFNFNADLPLHPTIFEYFEAPSNIYNMLTRGCPSHRNRTRTVKLPVYFAAHFWHRWDRADRVATKALLNGIREGDDCIFCVYPGVDGYAHLKYPMCDEAIEEYRYIDASIGQAFDVLSRQGQVEQTLVVITSDHGMAHTHTHLDLPKIWTRLGFRVMYYPRIWRRRPDCVEMVSGNGMAHIYFRGEAGWSERAYWDTLTRWGVPEAVLELEGIDFVCGLYDPSTVIVQTREGMGFLRNQEAHISYHFRGQDPLHLHVPLEPISYREALKLTLDTPYPDSLVQLTQIFMSERSGDLLISAQDGYDLRDRWEFPEHHSTHGALTRQQMEVPVLLNVPIDVACLRTVDLFPSLLALLGREIPDGIDGTNLFQETE